MTQAALNATKVRRVFWMKQFRQWHWISAAICLVGTFLFAVTGVTLNHAAHIPATPRTVEQKATLPPALLSSLAAQPEGNAPLPAPVAGWVRQQFGVDVAGREGEWSDIDIYVAMPRPGGDAFLTLDRESGEAGYSLTKRGAVSYLNDLHKGRNTGWWWRAFIDVFAAACVIFTVSGLGLLWMHAEARKITWPLVIAGTVLPLLIALFLIH